MKQRWEDVDPPVVFAVPGDSLTMRAERDGETVVLSYSRMLSNGLVFTVDYWPHREAVFAGKKRKWLVYSDEEFYPSAIVREAATAKVAAGEGRHVLVFPLDALAYETPGTLEAVEDHLD